jgi:hypothetical protein
MLQDCRRQEGIYKEGWKGEMIMAKCSIKAPYRRSRVYQIINEQDKVIDIQLSEKRAIQVAKNKARPGETFYIAKIRKVVRCPV